MAEFGRIPTQELGASEIRLIKEWRKWKWVTFVGYLNGIFPFSNFFDSSTIHDIYFKKCSLVYFFSWFMFLLKFVALISVMHIMRQANDALDFEQTYTDLISFGLASQLSFNFGMIAHFLLAVNIRDFIVIAQAMAKFNDAYPSTKVLSLKHRYADLNHLLSLMIALCPPYMFWHICKFGITGQPKVKMVLMGCWNSDEHLHILVGFVVAVMFTLEVAVVYLFGTLFTFTEGMNNLIDQMTIRAKNKACQDKTVKFDAWHLKSINQQGGTEQIWSWKRMSECYLDFCTLFEKYERFISNKLIALYGLLVLGSVAHAYHVIRSPNPMTKQFAFTQVMQVFAAFYRVACLSYIGESVTRKYGQLLGTLAAINQGGSVKIEERDHFKAYLTIVTNMPIFLSARGFFIVRRSNVTSILSVILTYLIILLQFGMADKTKFSIREQMETWKNPS